MARNGSGSYSLPALNPVVTGTSVSSTWANNTMNDIASALTQSVSNDGQTPITANLPMTGFKHTGVANAAARTEYCAAGQAQDNTFDWLTSVVGTDTITASAAIGLAAYAAGQTFRFVAAGANTGTSVTLNLNSLGAKSITKNGSTALAVGDIPSGCVVEVVYDGTRFQLVGVSVNYATTAGTATSATSATSATTATNIAGGASGSLPYQTGAGATGLLAKGSNGQLLTLAAGVPAWTTFASITSGTAQASTSGTSITFSGIPAGTKRITINFDGVSTNGTSLPIIQLGTSGGLALSGYLGSSSSIASAPTATLIFTVGFGIYANTAAGTISGSIVLSLLNASTNTWAANGVTAKSDAAICQVTAGSVALSGTLDRVSITTALNGTTLGSTDTFDAGQINILYE